MCSCKVACATIQCCIPVKIVSNISNIAGRNVAHNYANLRLQQQQPCNHSCWDNSLQPLATLSMLLGSMHLFMQAPFPPIFAALPMLQPSMQVFRQAPDKQHCHCCSHPCRCSGRRLSCNIGNAAGILENDFAGPSLHYCQYPSRKFIFLRGWAYTDWNSSCFTEYLAGTIVSIADATWHMALHMLQPTCISIHAATMMPTCFGTYCRNFTACNNQQ